MPNQQENNANYSYGRGVKLVQELLNRGLNVFTMEEIKPVAKEMDISEGYLSDQLLPKLQHSGWITRIRRGLYASTGGLPGTVNVPPFAIATNLVRPSAISHWSALHFHHFTEQIPHVIMAFTPKKVVTPSMRAAKRTGQHDKHVWVVEDLIYEFTTVIPEHYFGIEQVWVDQTFRVPMTDKERTILECVISCAVFGGMGEAMHIIDENIRSLDIEKLIGYAMKYGKASVIKRLGWILEQTGVKRNQLKPLFETPISSFRVLDPNRVRSGAYDKRWMIQNNLTAKPQ